MSYEKRYATETEAGRDEAYADAKEWLGEARLALLEAAIRDGRIKNMEHLHLVASFGGLAGFPVHVIGERSGLSA